MRILSKCILFIGVSILFACGNAEKEENKEPEYKRWKTMEVTATAYNSLGYQTTKNNSSLAAWGDTLKPGMKAIAVSRDLIEKGLDHNTRIKIEGKEGYYWVKDKMHRRWKNKIDIYMGTDIEKAREWGEQQVKIYVDTLQSKDVILR